MFRALDTAVTRQGRSGRRFSGNLVRVAAVAASHGCIRAGVLAYCTWSIPAFELRTAHGSAEHHLVTACWGALESEVASTNKQLLRTDRGKQVWDGLGCHLCISTPNQQPRSDFNNSAQMPVSLRVSAGCSSMCAVLFTKRLPPWDKYHVSVGKVS